MTSELKDEIDLFITHLAQERRLSAHTVSAYQRDLKHSQPFFANCNVKSWQEIKPNHVRQYLAELHRQGLASRSIHRVLSSLRSFFRFLIREALITQNPAQSVQAPKVEKRLPSTLDVDQVTSLLSAPEEGTMIACRDHAIMELFYSSGIRLSELANLDVRDIDLDDQLVYVTGKGNKSRVVPIGSKAIEALKVWLEQRQQMGRYEQTALFISKRGRRLGVRSIQQRLKYWGIQQGISGHVHPHRLRHAFASHMLESSGDLRAVQELLGHADISTTQVYTHVDFQHLANVYDNAHPRAKKK